MDFIDTIEIAAVPAPIMRELPDLEQTLGELMLDLLRARVEYPELVLAAPLDGHGKFSQEAVRVSQHYTMALLAYGYTPNQVELQEAARWFSIAFPSESNRRTPAPLPPMFGLITIGKRRPSAAATACEA